MASDCQIIPRLEGLPPAKRFRPVEDSLVDKENVSPCAVEVRLWGSSEDLVRKARKTFYNSASIVRDLVEDNRVVHGRGVVEAACAIPVSQAAEEVTLCAALSQMFSSLDMSSLS